MVVGTVVVLLVAVATVDSTRDALEIMDTFTKMSTVTVTSTRDAFAIVAPLKDVVHLVTTSVAIDIVAMLGHRTCRDLCTALLKDVHS